MIQVPAGARVVLAMQPIDFRKGAHSLGIHPTTAALLGYDRARLRSLL
jgi:hypothetical protein